MRNYRLVNHMSAVYNEQARWLTHVEFKSGQPLDKADQLFIRIHHRDLSKGYILH